jgi:hypothetical protein
MTDIKKPTDPRAATYAEQVKARAKARRKESPAIPNLVEAEAIHDPKRPTTIASLGTGLKRLEPEKEEPNREAGLSPETIAGLMEMKKMAEQKKSEAKAQSPEPEPEKLDPPKKERVQEPLDLIDDLEFERMMSQVRKDALNNDEQRKIIDARVRPIDLAKGIATGEFTQVVPIHPNILEVTYRSPSAFELQSIRVLLVKICAEDPTKETVSHELYTVMSLAASIVQISTDASNEKWPAHYTFGTRHSFDEEVFLYRVNKLLAMSGPLLHCIAVHGSWFDTRVRDALKVSELKSG